MYKCGWNGCEKAYGTLNHLNAHVTMQSHGAKRTPEGESRSVLLSCDSHFSSAALAIHVVVANGWIGLAPALAR